MNALAVAIIGGIIGGIVLLLLGSYFSSDSPEIFLESGCDTAFDINSPEISFIMRNRGDIEGYASICLTGQNIGFIDSGNESTFCYSEKRFSPMSTGLSRSFEADMVFLGDELPENLTIRITSTCNSKVWGLIPKNCQDFAKTCKYENLNSQYRLVK